MPEPIDHVLVTGPGPTYGPLLEMTGDQVRRVVGLCGQEAGKDCLSPTAQARHGFAVGRLPDCETLSSNPLSEALADNTRSPVD